MLLEQPSGLLGSGYLPNPVGEVACVVEDLEEEIVVFGFEDFLPAGQDGEGVVAVADDEVAREAVVYIPAGFGEPLLYLFGGYHHAFCLLAQALTP
jgi:hypothetical protein